MANNPEGFVPIHFLQASPKGRVISKPPGVTKQIQYAPICNNLIGYPTASNVTHGLSGDSRVVTCPDCQKTPEFRAHFKEQTGSEFGEEDKNANPPLED